MRCGPDASTETAMVLPATLSPQRGEDQRRRYRTRPDQPAGRAAAAARRPGARPGEGRRGARSPVAEVDGVPRQDAAGLGRPGPGRAEGRGHQRGPGRGRHDAGPFAAGSASARRRRRAGPQAGAAAPGRDAGPGAGQPHSRGGRRLGSAAGAARGGDATRARETGRVDAGPDRRRADRAGARASRFGHRRQPGRPLRRRPRRQPKQQQRGHRAGQHRLVRLQRRRHPQPGRAPARSALPSAVHRVPGRLRAAAGRRCPGHGRPGSSVAGRRTGVRPLQPEPGQQRRRFHVGRPRHPEGHPR